MPIYDYQCPKCQMVVEVIHTMDETDNPSLDTLKQIQCNHITCKTNENSSVLFTRLISGGVYQKFHSGTPAEKQASLKKRAHDYYKSNIEEKKMDMLKNIKPKM